MPNQSTFQQELAPFVAKVLRDHFGKGPESVYISMQHKYVFIYLRGLMTNMERVLIEQGEDRIVNMLREQLSRRFLPEIRAFISISLETDVTDVYFDWNLDLMSGMILVQTQNALQSSKVAIKNITLHLERSHPFICPQQNLGDD